MMRPASWSETSMRYDYYWPAIQAAANSSGGPRRSRCAGYLDVAREQGRGQGVAALMRVLKSPASEQPPFAPSFLNAGRWLMHRHQYSAVPRPALGLVPKPETSRLWAHQLQLTVEDLVIETHATRHPLAAILTITNKSRGAARRAAYFTAQRAPQFLDNIEKISANNAAGKPKIPQLLELHERVARLPRIAAYLTSARRAAFSKDDIFRHYSELKK